MQKLIDFPDEQMKQIQDYADKECEGNASQAVRRLSNTALKIYEDWEKGHKALSEEHTDDNAR